MNPEVHVYRYPGKELVARFKANTTVRLLDMAFSRDGRYLLLVGGVPDFRLSIYDLEENKMLAIKPEAKLPCKAAEYRKAKFNPANDREFAILTESAVYFYQMIEGFEGQLVDGAVGDDQEENKDHYEVDKHDRLAVTEYRNENPQLRFNSFAWDQFRNVHVCCDLPLILQIDSRSG